mmetsp:Transcript_19643/g.59488  ORF Transcript_19643/g.59488 Transcript_19643/m.59488 type:complete len:442 (-) Transcript_19643:1077-2402(-)
MAEYATPGTAFRMSPLEEDEVATRATLGTRGTMGTRTTTSTTLTRRSGDPFYASRRRYSQWKMTLVADPLADDVPVGRTRALRQYQISPSERSVDSMYCGTHNETPGPEHYGYPNETMESVAESTRTRAMSNASTMKGSMGWGERVFEETIHQRSLSPAPGEYNPKDSTVMSRHPTFMKRMSNTDTMELERLTRKVHTLRWTVTMLREELTGEAKNRPSVSRHFKREHKLKELKRLKQEHNALLAELRGMRKALGYEEAGRGSPLRMTPSIPATRKGGGLDTSIKLSHIPSRTGTPTPSSASPKLARMELSKSPVSFMTPESAFKRVRPGTTPLNKTTDRFFHPLVATSSAKLVPGPGTHDLPLHVERFGYENLHKAPRSPSERRPLDPLLRLDRSMSALRLNPKTGVPYYGYRPTPGPGEYHPDVIPKVEKRQGTQTRWT